jgi:peptide/nickel transport system permease protein
MRTYILKRLLLMIPTIIGITMLTYLIVRLAPGDAIEALIRNQAGSIDPKAMKASADKIRERLGLKDRNLWGAWIESYEAPLAGLQSSEANVRQAAAATLRELTGVNINENYDAWKDWTSREAEKWNANTRQAAIDRIRDLSGVDIEAVGSWKDWIDAQAEAHGTPIEALRPLVNDLLRPKADVRERASEKLRHLTDRDFTADPQAWDAWWARNQDAVEKSLIDPAEKVLNAFLGYGQWVSHLAQGDLGESIKFKTSSGSNAPLALIIDRAPVSATLNIISEFLIFMIAIPAGLMAARYQGTFLDRFPSFVMLVLWSVPHILAGTVLLGYLAQGGSGFHWFPTDSLHSFGSGDMSSAKYLTDTLWHATLPVACLTYGGFAYLAKLGRASLLENLRADYVRTARAKGLPESRVVYHHALRNSLLPMITVMVLTIPGLIGGSVVVEKIFSIQGTGLLLVDAATSFDLSVIMADTLMYGILTLLFLLIGDICYAWADPRVRYE